MGLRSAASLPLLSPPPPSARASDARRACVCGTGLYVRYDKYEWGHWTDRDPTSEPVRASEWILGFERRGPRFGAPWNSSQPVAFWEVDQRRMHFIRTGERTETRTSRCGQLVVFGLGIDVSSVAKRLHSAGYGTMYRFPMDKQFIMVMRARHLMKTVINGVLSRQSNGVLSSRVGGIQAMEAAADGTLGRLIGSRAYSELVPERLEMEYLLSIHTAHQPIALALHEWMELLLPLARDLLQSPVCLVVVRDPEALRDDDGVDVLVWEMHLLATLHACVGLRKVLLPCGTDEAADAAVAALREVFPGGCERGGQQAGGGGPTTTGGTTGRDTTGRDTTGRDTTGRDTTGSSISQHPALRVKASDETKKWPRSARRLWAALVSGEALAWRADQIPPHGVSTFPNHRAIMTKALSDRRAGKLPFRGVCCEEPKAPPLGSARNGFGEWHFTQQARSGNKYGLR